MDSQPLIQQNLQQPSQLPLTPKKITISFSYTLIVLIIVIILDISAVGYNILVHSAIRKTIQESHIAPTASSLKGTSQLDLTNPKPGKSSIGNPELKPKSLNPDIAKLFDWRVTNTEVLKQQPYFDKNSGKIVRLNKHYRTNPVTYDIEVTDIKTNTRKSFTYDKSSSVDQLFILNNFAYFTSGYDNLKKIFQMNLDTGQFSTPSGVPKLTEKVADENTLILSDKGISPDGRYFIYNLEYRSDKIGMGHFGQDIYKTKRYLYDLYLNQETELNANGFTKWSPDSKYILFTDYVSDGIVYSLYSIDSKELKVY